MIRQVCQAIVRNALGTLSRTTFYKWLKRYQKDGLKGLLDRPKTPLRKRAPTVRKKYEPERKTSRNTKLFTKEAMKYFGFSISKV
ncbi:MAG: helix-turn-helix domain-containing protein [Hydrogenobaculum sp.]